MSQISEHLMHPLDRVALHAAVGRALQALAPVRQSNELFELARPHLIPIVRWRCFVRSEVSTDGQRRAAEVALAMLVGRTPRLWANWLETYGATPGSPTAIAARLRGVQYLPMLTMDDYVRVMMHWDRGGVWEYLLARQFADAIDLAPANAGPRQQAYIARCERLTGKRPEQLWHDFHTAWAVRPSLRRWGE